MKKLEQIFVTLNGWVVIAMLATMAIVVGSNVGLRYFFTYSLPWADEVARYLMIWMTFIGAGLALRAGGHVAITNLQDALPGLGQKILRALILLILLAFFLKMVEVGLSYAERMGRQKTPALRISFYYIYLAMPLGFGLLIVHTLLLAREFITAGTYPASTIDTDGAHG
ncbi:TRAP transporter small permease [Chachezhania sediminis]|uniref:TRAP transporter small permease n=1 Tax=Chachezhania sediminis TaxID=2599291 RepID=UPI00131A9529|nr:TRAP transporter small permease [Chachezhania sediminis]